MDSERNPSIPASQDPNSLVQDIPHSSSEFLALVSKRKEERKAKTKEMRVTTLRILENKIAKQEREAGTKLFGLPDTVWSIEILPLIQDPRDLGSMWEVHPKFRKFSRETPKNEVLLSKVLSIQDLPHVSKNDEEWMDLLCTLRKLSKGTRAAIDGIIENHFMMTLGSINYLPYTTEICVSDPPFRELESMVADFREGSRLFRHSLRFFWIPDGRMTDEGFLELKRKTRVFLERLGDQIWHFVFYVDLCTEPAEEVYLYLRLWLSMMPNLKCLEFDIAFWEDDIDLAVVRNHPMPLLNNLERISLKCCDIVQSHYALVSAVIQSNRETIKTLEFSDSITFGHFFAEMIPLLSTLKLDMLIGYNLEILHPVASLFWNLCKLKHIFDGLEEECPRLQTIFHFINSIVTLKELDLGNVKNVTVGEQVPLLRLRNLVVFKLGFKVRSVNYEEDKNILFFTSLQFLLQSKRLKTLKWSWSWSFHAYNNPDSLKIFKSFLLINEENEIIKFKCGLQDKLFASNLWDVFPNLELLDICVPREAGKSLVIRKPRPPMM